MLLERWRRGLRSRNHRSSWSWFIQNYLHLVWGNVFDSSNSFLMLVLLSWHLYLNTRLIETKRIFSSHFSLFFNFWFGQLDRWINFSVPWHWISLRAFGLTTLKSRDMKLVSFINWLTILLFDWNSALKDRWLLFCCLKRVFFGSLLLLNSLMNLLKISDLLLCSWLLLKVYFLFIWFKLLTTNYSLIKIKILLIFKLTSMRSCCLNSWDIHLCGWAVLIIHDERPEAI